jgi:membrane protein
MLNLINTIWSLLSETFKEWSDDRAERLGAALAYYAAFSMAPLLVIIVSIVNFVYRTDELPQVQRQIALVVGNRAAEAIVATIRGIHAQGGSTMATVISIITLLIGATGLFTGLQDAMNTIWNVPPRPVRLWSEFLRTRFLSFVLVIAISILLLASLVLSAALAAIGAYFQAWFPITAAVWPLMDFFVSFGITTVLFAMIFKILPDVYVRWSDVWIGAAVTAALFAIGKIIIGMYLGRSAFVSAYGAAGSLAVLLVWVYYSAQILFLGAEFTQVYANRYSKRLERLEH